MKKVLSLFFSVLLLLTSCAGADSVSGELHSASEEEASAIEQLLSALPESEAEDNPGNDPEYDTDKLIFSSMASSGEIIWRIDGEEIICADLILQKDVAQFPLDDLYNSGAGLAALKTAGIPSGTEYGAEWLSLISKDEKGVWLCAALTDETDAIRVLLYDLAFTNQRITINGVKDSTEALGPFFDRNAGWLEIDITSYNENAFLISALDQNHQFNMSCYHPENDQLKDLGSQPLLLYTSIVPCGSSMLLAGFSIESNTALDLTPIDPATGDRKNPITVETEFNPTSAVNYAWNQEEHMLYFTVDNTAYKFDPNSGEKPVPFYVLKQNPFMNRLGLSVGNQYILYSTDGNLIFTDIHSELKATRIRVADVTGDGNLPDIAAEYNTAQAANYVTVPSCDNDDLILEYLMNQSADNDIYVLFMNSNAFHAMLDRGFCPDLGGSEIIRNAVASMPEYIRSTVSSGESPAALPICTFDESLALNVKAMQDLTGLSREELPTDWVDFLHLLNQISKDGILQENARYTVYEYAYTAYGLKEALFSLIMSDCLVWMNRNHADPDAIPGMLLPVLHAFSQIDWNGFGLPEEEPEDLTWLLANEQIPLLSVIQPEITLTVLEDGVEYWPLSLSTDSDRLISQTVSVMVINPWSTHPQEAIAFMEYAWEHLNVLSKMALCPDLNKPVPNTAYDEDIAYLEQMIAIYDDALAGAEPETSTEALRMERNEAAEFLEDYQRNGHWLASTESIAEYRALSAQMAPAVPEFWSADNEDAAVLQFLDGMIPAEQFVTQYVEAIKTSRMEGY